MWIINDNNNNDNNNNSNNNNDNNNNFKPHHITRLKLTIIDTITILAIQNYNAS